MADLPDAASAAAGRDDAAASDATGRSRASSSDDLEPELSEDVLATIYQPLEHDEFRLSRRCERSEAIQEADELGLDCFVANAPRNDV
ncbi:MAG: hypothetical protein J0H75_08985 [Rhizobiales bacterium]|nr:hypothetical protein [Hyphomicrobiales bacterium]